MDPCAAQTTFWTPSGPFPVLGMRIQIQSAVAHRQSVPRPRALRQSPPDHTHGSVPFKFGTQARVSTELTGQIKWSVRQVSVPQHLRGPNRPCPLLWQHRGWNSLLSTSPRPASSLGSSAKRPSSGQPSDSLISGRFNLAR
jgi:hypothetical protein